MPKGNDAIQRCEPHPPRHASVEDMPLAYTLLQLVVIDAEYADEDAWRHVPRTVDRWERAGWYVAKMDISRDLARITFGRDVTYDAPTETAIQIQPL